MSQYYKPNKHSAWLFNPNGKNNFKLSRSKIDLFLECPRCFYLDRKLGLGRPSIKEEPDTFNKNRNVARRGGGVARVARKKIETETGKKVVSGSKYLPQGRKRLNKNDKYT